MKNRTPQQSIDRGMVLASEDRRRYGLVLEHEIGFNLSLSSLKSICSAGFIRRNDETKRNQAIFGDLRIKATGLDAIAGRLSGGNQQKIVLGKALLTEPSVILLDEPTRGIDVGAKLEIYELVNELAAAGLAVLLVSSELPELLGLSDRVLVLGDGRLRGEIVAGEFAHHREAGEPERHVDATRVFARDLALQRLAVRGAKRAMNALSRPEAKPYGATPAANRCSRWPSARASASN